VIFGQVVFYLTLKLALITAAIFLVTCPQKLDRLEMEKSGGQGNLMLDAKQGVACSNHAGVDFFILPNNSPFTHSSGVYFLDTLWTLEKI